MLENIAGMLEEVEKFDSTNKADIETFRLKFNGKKGILTDLFEEFKKIPNEHKKEAGQKINALKQSFQTKLDELKNASKTEKISVKEDLTKPGFPLELGTRHPISLERKSRFG